MAAAPEPSLDDHLWTIAVARLILPADVSLQAPPNLAYDGFPRLLEAGINDWGGVSPVTPDHVNPGGAVARPRPARRGHRRRRPDAAAAARRVPALPARRRPPGSIRRCVPSVNAAADGLGLARPAEEWFIGASGGTPPSWSRPRTRRRLGGVRRGARGDRPHAGAGHGAAVGPRARRSTCWSAAADARARRAQRRRGHLRRLPEHQLHQRLLLQVRLLRVLEGQAGGEPARARPTCSAATRSSAAATRRGSAAAPRSACRAASTRASPASGTSSWSRRSAPSCPTCTSTRSRRSRSGRARTRPTCRCATTWRACATPGSARCPAPRPRSSTTTCAARSAPTRSRRRSGSR